MPGPSLSRLLLTSCEYVCTRINSEFSNVLRALITDEQILAGRIDDNEHWCGTGAKRRPSEWRRNAGSGIDRISGNISRTHISDIQKLAGGIDGNRDRICAGGEGRSRHSRQSATGGVDHQDREVAGRRVDHVYETFRRVNR